MGKGSGGLRAAIGGDCSRDVVAARMPVGEVFAPEAEIKAGPVATKVDLSMMERASGKFYRQQRLALTACKTSLYVSRALYERLDVGRKKYDLLMNKTGSIVALVEAREAVAVKITPCGKKRNTGRIGASRLIHRLEARGVALPATYEVEWDEENQAWIGRLAKERAERG